MVNTFYFMAGLPRSGSTMLSSVLNQNPRIYSGPSSPVLGAVFALDAHFKNNELYEGYPKPKEVNRVIGSIIENFYSDIEKPVVIDKNRAWTARVPYINSFITKNIKIIVPVRRIDEIIASMLSMVHRNPYKEGQSRINFVDEQLIKKNIPISDVNRCTNLINQGGVIYDSLEAIRRGFADNAAHCMHFVDYNDLVNDPQKELNKIYEFLGEESYEHDFDSLSNVNREHDMKTYGISDMHEVRPKLKKTSPPPESIVPAEIMQIYTQNKEKLEFWKNPGILNLPPTQQPASQFNTNQSTFLGTKI